MAAIISMVGAMYYVISNHSFLIANHTPLSLEMMLGDYTEKLLSLNSKNDLTENKNLNKIIEKLSQHLDTPHAIKIYIFHTKKPPNALALPNRKIYVYSTLIESTHSPDELTGIIAHEMAHIIKHHATIHYLRHLSLSLMLKSSIGAGNTVDIAGLLLNPYSQAIEIEADTIAAEILHRNNISSAGLKTFFDNIRTPEDDLFLSNFLSTHPSSDIRINHLNLLPAVAVSEPILTDAEWLELKQVCQDSKPSVTTL
jgi:Zn-dependent protease with chaperone function